MDNFFALNYGISFDVFFQSPHISFSFSPSCAQFCKWKNHSQHTFCCDPLVSECASVIFPDISRYNANAILRRPSAKPATIPVEIWNPNSTPGPFPSESGVSDSGTIPVGIRSRKFDSGPIPVGIRGRKFIPVGTQGNMSRILA